MTWSKTPPTEPGWYWVRNSFGDCRVQEVGIHWGRLCTMHWGLGSCHDPVEGYDGLWWPEKLQPPTGAGGETHAD